MELEKTFVGFFYFDETIRENGSFIIGAFVYSERDITPDVFSALQQVGMKPKTDEFKSYITKDGDSQQQKLRAILESTFLHLNIGVIVIPIENRALLGSEALNGLKKIINANRLDNISHQIFFDQGISFNNDIKANFDREMGKLCTLHINQDSKLISGIQLADLAAHYLGGMLLEQLGLINKKIRAGDNSGYDPDTMLDLGFELWASLRYSFFKSPNPIGATKEDPISEIIFDVENYGLYISSSCSTYLRDAAIRRFGQCYLGCIH